MRLDQQDHDIGIGCPTPGSSHHGPVEPPSGPEKTRRVHEHDLRIASHCNAANAGARCLHLVRHDRDLGPDHPVEKR
jgi:hypothetical protein